MEWGRLILFALVIMFALMPNGEKPMELCLGALLGSITNQRYRERFWSGGKNAG